MTYNAPMIDSSGNRVTRCRNCPERFAWKKGKKFCSVKCRDQFHNAGGTPTQALERRIYSLLKSERFLKLLRTEIRELLQRAHAVQPQPVEIYEESAKQKAGSVKTASSV